MNQDIKEQAKIKLIEAEDELYEQRLDGALALFEEAMMLFRKAGEESPAGRVLFRIGEVYERKELYSVAREQYEKAFEFFSAAGDIFGSAAALNNMGKTWHLKGDINKAFLLYQESLSTLLEQDAFDLVGVATVYHNLGTVYEEKRKMTAALDYFERSYAVFRELGRDEMVDIVGKRIINLIITHPAKLNLDDIPGKSCMIHIVDTLLDRAGEGSPEDLFIFTMLSEILGPGNFNIIYDRLPETSKVKCREFWPGWDTGDSVMTGINTERGAAYFSL